MVLIMEITNHRICNFYKENPNIDFNNVNLLFIELYENIIHNKLIQKNEENSTKNDHFKYLFSSLKDEIINYNKENINQNYIIDKISDIINRKSMNSPENIQQFIISLNKLFKTSEVLHLKEYNDVQIYSIKRYLKPKIIVETIENEYNIDDNHISNFLKILDDKNSHGIFISQNSGISSKPNFHIDYVHGNIALYIHNCNFSIDKIKLAIDIIDNLYVKLKEFNNSANDNVVPISILDDINKEYQLFISQKEALINVYKDCQKKVLSQIDEIRFPCLDKYLSTKYTNPVQKHGFKCDLCKCFNANNLKALAAHKRGCARKNVFISSQTTI